MDNANAINNGKIKLKEAKPTWQQILFYVSFVGLPLIQFVIFYIVVNIKSILFAFQTYDAGVYTFTGFQNFGKFFRDLFVGTDLNALTIRASFKNSIILYLVGIVVTTPMALIFSSYIYKKHPGSKVFRILLYLPHIASTVTVVTCYKYFLNFFIPDLWQNLFGKEIPQLMLKQQDSFFYIMFIHLYLGFGNNVLIYSSTMSGISPSIVESAQLDGISSSKEFLHITLPSIFPTFTTFFVSGMAMMFTDQMLLVNFYDMSAPSLYQTVGYYMYHGVAEAVDAPALFPYLSAMGLVITAVLTATTFTAKYLLNRFGPSPE